MNVQPTEPPQPARFERRKAVIVRAAVEAINRKGVRGMTLAEVAAQLDLVPTGVSYYFRRKEELAAACFLQAIARYNGFVDEAMAERSVPARLARFLHGYCAALADIQAGRGDGIAVLNDIRTIHDPVVDAAYTDLFRRFRRLLTPEGSDRPVRLHRNAQAHLVISQVFWAVVWLPKYDPRDYHRCMDRMLDILIHGVATKTTAWRPDDLPAPQPPAASPAVSPEAFLRAATELINEHGYLGASVTRISARLNVTKGSFYHHNQAKDEVVHGCFERTLKIMRDAQESADRLTSSGFDNLTSVAASLVRHDITGERPLLRTSALTAVPEDMRKTLISRFDQISARFSSVISDGIADGSIRPVESNIAAQMTTAMINAAAELHHWSPEITGENAADVYARPLFMGLFPT